VTMAAKKSSKRSSRKSKLQSRAVRSKDFSNTTVMVMLVVVIIVSVVSLGVYMKSVYDAQPKLPDQLEAGGVVSLQIVQSDHPVSKGVVSLQVTKPASTGVGEN